MAIVFLPPQLRPLADDQVSVDVEGETVRELIQALDRRYNGIQALLCDGNRLRPGLQVVVGDAVSAMGLLAAVAPDDEVHFLPSVGGG